MNKTTYFTRGDYVKIGKSSTVWRIISVSVRGSQQYATMRSTTPGSTAWRYDKPLKDAELTDKPAT
jgi:hypothetical protein